ALVGVHGSSTMKDGGDRDATTALVGVHGSSTMKDGGDRDATTAFVGVHGASTMNSQTRNLIFKCAGSNA
ncbi:MAG: hypothetical protein JWN96_4195, partial [Mycobacterium sp.]|nr:hypothetical protein [Mycobacterium sp.]